MVNQGFTSIDQLRDVESLNRFRELVADGRTESEALAEVLAGSRDHARMPMPWTSSGGFTTGTPWISGDVGVCDVESSAGDPDSVLEWHRSLIALRRSCRALVYGAVEFTRGGGHVWTYRRALDGDEVVVVLNLSDRPRRHPSVAGELALHSGPGEPGRLAAYEAKVFVQR